ncbi:hypothetical protein [Prochlorococcus sp. MIT 1300]|uniref:hypothetical protein n=1 Tax=Prochlorococcus sp. MIT 1300 TaxID=3096218 RepID=UPI002A75B3FB|nr:hypothetical protein [Prochlorococcus sp. MIT 1300]
MRIQSDLCHIDQSRCVVKVSAFENDGENLIGSALGEANGAEDAESRALKRLMERVSTESSLNTSDKENQAHILSKQIDKPKHIAEESKKGASFKTKEVIPSSSAIHNQIPSEDPEDWTEELAQVELEIKRIGWSRIDESKYLDRAMGYSSRQLITQYSELISYLNQLKKFVKDESPESADIPLKRGDLITESNSILKELNWDIAKSRAYLLESMKVKSRQDLSDEKLMQFNNILLEKLKLKLNKDLS